MELSPKEIKNILNFIINNNFTLQDSGKDPIAVNIEGVAGISKTSIVEQVAKERGFNYVKLSLSQILDVGDLIGFPVKEYYICKEYPDHPEDNECKWVPNDILHHFIDSGWIVSGDSRLGYTIPLWLKNIDETKPTILNLDDYSRCQSSVSQAVMEIIYKQEFVSWKLPKYTTVVCTSNPDDGSYNVVSLDEAAKTRLVTFNMKFDIKSWMEWAETAEIDGRCINFLGLYWEELMDRSKAKIARVNARNYTMFANIIKGIDNWSDTNNLAFILQIASGCFLDDDDIVGGLFTTFISNKLDKLISPEDLVNKSWDYVKKELEDQLYDNDQYKSDIASIITTRFINYSFIYLKQPGAKTEIITNRILEIVENKKMLLSEDLLFHLIKTLNKQFPGRCNKLLLNPKFAKRLI